MELFNCNKCPQCKNKIKTLSTRHNPSYTTRRKECVKCKFRFTTAELNYEIVKIVSSKKMLEHFDAVLKLKTVRSLLNKPDTSIVDLKTIIKEEITIKEEQLNSKPTKIKIKKLPRRDPQKEMLKFLADVEKKKEKGKS